MCENTLHSIERNMDGRARQQQLANGYWSRPELAKMRPADRGTLSWLMSHWRGGKVPGLVDADLETLAEGYGDTPARLGRAIKRLEKAGILVWNVRKKVLFSPAWFRISGKSRSQKLRKGYENELGAVACPAIREMLKYEILVHFGPQRQMAETPRRQPAPIPYLETPYIGDRVPPHALSAAPQAAAPQTPAADRLAGASRHTTDEAAGRLPAAALGPVEDDTALPPGCPDPFEGSPLAALPPPRFAKPRQPHRARPRICTARQAWRAAVFFESGMSVVPPMDPSIAAPTPTQPCPALRPLVHLGGARAAS